jgi:ribosomal protein S18 acetylase RimI-like enzyme
MTLALRPATDGDAELLYEIYASTRQEELAPLDWEASVKEAFLRQQFAAQDTYYRATFRQASYDLIVDGEEVLGRLYVDRGKVVWLVLDIALLPAHRGRGIGSQLLQQVIAEAEAAGSPVQIHVERLNPARRLYERLGFRQIEDQGIYLLLERPPARAQS